MAGVGVVILVVSVAVLAREAARSPDWGTGPLLGIAGGVLLVIVGVATIRDRRRFPPDYRSDDDGPGVLFPYSPPHPDAGAAGSYDYGGGGGGDCGGGGGGS